MSTVGQFSSRNPTIKRILKEASELANQPSSDYHAAPLENDLFEWHFTIRGAPAPSPFDSGLYHGRIILPPAYPLKPPSFRFLTPTGRFEVNREICLSISGHHEETWQPAWGIRTALVAIRSFMDTDARGQLGGMEASEEVRRRLAGQSRGWKCPVCAKGNEVLMQEQEKAVRERGGDGGEKEELVPEELRLAYREDLSQANGKAEDGAKRQPNGTLPEQHPSPGPDATVAQPIPANPTPSQSQPPAAAASGPQEAGQVPPAPQQRLQQQQQRRQNEVIPAWIDKAIYGLLAALLYLLWQKFAK